MKKNIIISLVSTTLLLFIIIAINQTNILYQESQDYQASASPTYLKPEAAPIKLIDPAHKTMILFIHGYKSSPYDFKALAEHFSHAYDVAVPLLPGHGTTPEDFKQTYYSQWYEAIKNQYLTYRRQYQTVYIVGLSMGGTLTLTLAEQCQEPLAPNGIVTLAAPVFLNNFLEKGVLYDWRLYFSRIASWFFTELEEPISQADDDGANEVFYKGKNYLKQVHSLKMGLKRANKKLSTITVPILLMHATGDKTVPFENMDYIKNKVASKLILTKTVDLSNWDHDRHMITLYQTSQPQVIAEVESFLKQLNN